MTLVDTNILLRWLLGDHKELSAKAEKLVQNANKSSLLVTDLIAAEVVYVLRSTGRDRVQVGEALLLLGRESAFKLENEELMTDVTRLLVETKLDFADCYLLARAKREQLKLETFDAALNKLFMKL